MKLSQNASVGRLFCAAAVALAVTCLVFPAQAQTCQTASDMDAAVRSALEATGRRYFDLAAHGDTAGLKQNAIPSLESNFGGIESAIKEIQPALAGAQVTI